MTDEYLLRCPYGHDSPYSSKDKPTIHHGGYSEHRATVTCETCKRTFEIETLVLNITDWLGEYVVAHQTSIVVKEVYDPLLFSGRLWTGQNLTFITKEAHNDKVDYESSEMNDQPFDSQV